MNSFDYAKLNEAPPPQQQSREDVNMIDVVVRPTNQQYNTQPQFPKPRWGWGTLILSMLSMCCCGLLGFIATVVSVLSYVDHKSNDYGRAQNKRNHARNLAIAAIIIGVLFIIAYAVMVYFLAVYTADTAADIASAVDNINHEVQADLGTTRPNYFNWGN